MQLFFSGHFKKQLKTLKKKYPHVKKDLLGMLADFNPREAIFVGKSIFKIRIPSTDMRKGKSGGFRAYLYLHVRKDFLVPLCMYAKPESESITENELKHHFDSTIKEVVWLI